MQQHPHIQSLHKIYLSETQPFRKVHRMIDLFETIIKTHTAVMMGEYFKHNQISDTAKGMLAAGLRTPSLGTWQLFSRELYKELKDAGHVFLCKDFVTAFEALDIALNKEKTNVISFRNGYAHGATPADDQCENDIKQFEPFLNTLISLQWLKESGIESIYGKVHLKTGNDSLNLHPIIAYRADEAELPFVFFNDLKNDKVGLLNYPLSKHYRDKSFFSEFNQYLPLQDWKKTGSNIFNQRIEELTETFKGRLVERATIKNFVITQQKGFLSIQGNPGIGKSALIAQVYKDLTNSEEKLPIQLMEYFIRRGTPQAEVSYLINHLLKKTDELFPAGKEIRAEEQTTWELQQQLYNKWTAFRETDSPFKIIFLIDGLDEGVENDILKYLPRTNFNNILFIFGSRPGGHQQLEKFWGELPVEHHQKIELVGLSKEDIRALLYEVANKYEIDKDSKWIDYLQQRSQGNPLYLKLLCNAIEEGSIAINDFKSLPKEIDDYYKAILQRYSQMPDGDNLLNCLFVFAAARDYLTPIHLSEILGLGPATQTNVMSTLVEVLYENPMTETVLDYQLFHESLRDYLKKDRATEVAKAEQKIIEFCGRWKEFEGAWEQRYTLQHYAEHLFESKQKVIEDRLINLIYDIDYVTTQKRVLRGFDSINTLYRKALMKSSEHNRFDDMLESALCLVDIKYEEANDASQIVEMVTNGEIDLALKRIESFGGVDKESLKRKFILYIICLIELTLRRKESEVNKNFVIKLINHLDDNIPSDHSLFCWEEFFSPKLMFIVSCELKSNNIDYKILYNKSYNGLMDWVSVDCSYSDLQISTLLEISRNGIYINNIVNSLVIISKNLVNNNKLIFAEELLNEAIILNRENKSGAFSKFYNFINIANGFTNISNYNYALEIISEAESVLSEIEDYPNKMSGFVLLSDWYLKNDDLDRAKKYNYILEKDEYYKEWSLQDLAYYYVRNNKLNKGEELALSLNGEYEKFIVLKGISDLLFNENNKEESKSIFSKAIEFIQKIEDDWNKSYAILDVVDISLKFNEIEIAVKFIKQISLLKLRISAYLKVSKYYRKTGFDEYSQKYFNLGLNLIEKIKDDWDRDEAIEYLILFHIENNCLNNALETISNLSSESNKKDDVTRAIISKLMDTCSESNFYNLLILLQQNNREVYQEVKTYFLNELIQSTKNDTLIEKKIHLLKEIGYDRLIPEDLGKFTNSLFLKFDSNVCFEKLDMIFTSVDEIQSISSRIICKINILSEIPIRFWEKFDFAFQSILEYFNQNSELFNQIKIIKDNLDKISKLFNKQIIANLLLKKSHEVEMISDKSPDFSNQSEILINLALSYFEFGESEQFKAILDQAFNVESIENKRNDNRVRRLSQVATGLISLNHFSTAKVYIDQAFVLASEIKESEFMRKYFLQDISKLYHDMNEFELSEKVIEYIGSKDNSEAYKNISLKYLSNDNLIIGVSIINQISDLGVKYKTWQEMSVLLYKKYGFSNAIDKISLLNEEIAKKLFLLGLSKKISPIDCDYDSLFQLLKLMYDNTFCVENILQAYSLNQIIFKKPSKELINRLNRTLNIQWALDIIAKFPKQENVVRMSTNLEEWIEEVVDEDDREQIELWARQVSKGKITEEEFGERVKGMK